MKKFFLWIFLLSAVFAGSGYAGTNPVIQEGSAVTMAYSIKSEGKVVDQKKKNEPLEFQMGKQTLAFPAFEKKMIGMRAGEKKKFDLKPEEAFGPWHEQRTQVFPRAHFQDLKLKRGMSLTASSSTGALNGRVLKVSDEQVLIDFNHPLAGKTLQVEVKVIEVK